MGNLYDATRRPAGTECSSTGEGRHLTFPESYLTHPARTGGLVVAGDPVNVGNIVGVAFNGASAATDLISIDTEGIWFLNVVASDGSGTSNVAVGDQLYIATGVVSKIASGTPFGRACSVLTGSASAAVCAVKVHGSQSGVSTRAGHQFTVTAPVSAAADVANKLVWVAPGSCKIVSAVESHSTVAGQAGNLNIEKCNTGEAAGAGDETLATGWDLTSTINTPVSLNALTSGVQDLVAGDALRLKLHSGSATSLAGCVVTVLMEWT